MDIKLPLVTSVDFPFRQFLSPTTLTTQHAATVGDHDSTRGPENDDKGEQEGVQGKCTRYARYLFLFFQLN